MSEATMDQSPVCRSCGSTDIMRVQRKMWERALPISVFWCRYCGHRFRVRRSPDDVDRHGGSGLRVVPKPVRVSDDDETLVGGIDIVESRIEEVLALLAKQHTERRQLLIPALDRVMLSTECRIQNLVSLVQGTSGFGDRAGASVLQPALF